MASRLSAQKWKTLGGNLRMGDISKNDQGVRVQGVKITG
jgi:hypothetical protein